MSGYFGVISKSDCVSDLFYGTDYHSHLGTVRGGLVTRNEKGFCRFIHDITTSQFRSKFENDIPKMSGSCGIGIISDYEDQPLIIGSHLGPYAIVTVGKINNMDELVQKAFKSRTTHFTQMDMGEVNPTELVAALINQAPTFADGIRNAQDLIKGSCSLMLLTSEGIYAARDRLGRTPLILGQKAGAYAATLETCAFGNLGYEMVRELGPGEVVLMTPDGVEQKLPPYERMQICTFLWIYYGYPASTYEGVNAEMARYGTGAALARQDTVKPDLVAGIPDSGTGHAIGYANEAKIPFARPFVKYTPTWPRSFMPQDQTGRELVASMKLIPIKEMVQGRRLLFCEDSIVRGTQLGDTVQQLFEYGAREIHMRPACPPLVFGCKFLNFSRSRSESELASRKAIKALEGKEDKHLEEYACTGSEKQCAMVERIAQQLRLSSLQYLTLEDMVQAIGLPREKLCTYCWNGAE